MRISRFYVDKSNIKIGETINLNQEDINHIRTVLRLKKGDNVEIFNDTEEYLAELSLVSTKKVTARILKSNTNNINTKQIFSINLFQSLIKPIKLDELVRIHTELGTSNFYPIQTEFSIIKKENIQNRINRWQKILVSAAKQSSRIGLMNLHSPIDFKESISIAKNTSDIVIFLEVKNKLAIHKIDITLNLLNKIIEYKKNKKKNKELVISVFIGPEAGFSKTEINLAIEHKFDFCCLSNNILRSETASIAIITLLKFIELQCIV